MVGGWGLGRARSSEGKGSRLVAAAVVAVLVAAVSAVSVVVDQRSAAAAGGLSCGDVFTQQGANPRNIWQIDRTTGGQTSVGTFSIPGTSGNLNGVGIYDADTDGYGEVMTGVQPANTGTARSIYQYSSITGQTTLLGAGVAGAAVTHGAINQANGHYYYGGVTGGTLNVYGFNTTTNQSMGLVASGAIPNGGGNGDWAFDSQGNLYVVAGGSGAGTVNVVSVIDQKIPTSAGTPVAITGTELVRIDAGGTALNAIAFAGDGYLYVAGGPRMYKVNPTTGTVISNVPFATAGTVDMASCASPNTVSIVKDFPAGRHTASDQVTMTISGDGITKGNTATTAGTASGVQPQEAGPVLVLSGQQITVTETGTGTGRPKYDSSWTCVDRNSGNVLASGTGSTGSFIVPDGGPKGVAAVCTFTNGARLPHVSLEKTASTSTLVASETVTYSFKVTNDGNVPLHDISVSETAFTGAGAVSAISCPALPQPLATGASTTCTASYVVRQADVNAGAVDNTATARAVSPDDIAVTSTPSSVRLTATQTPGISIKKSSDTAVLVVGETVKFSFVVTNTGNVTLNNVGVNETAFTGAGTMSAVSCPADRTLAPGAQLVCTATYVVQQADVDAGSMDNTATATGTPPSGIPVTSDPSTTRTPSVPEPSVSIVKTADRATLVAGQTVTYSFRVTNTGNVTLTNASVVEGTFSGAGSLSAVTCPSDRTLSPNEFMDCTAMYVVQQADVDAGAVDNTATATGTPPSGGPVTSDPSAAHLTAAQTPSVSLVKTADRTNLVVGQKITYTFTIANTGNVTLTDAAVVEGAFSGAGTLSDVSCPADRTLAPGGELECTATYVVQQADVDAGAIDNTATATGTPPTGEPVVSAPSEAKITGAQAPAITIAKTANRTNLLAGDTVTYSFRVTNTGNVTLTDASVAEGEFTGAGSLSAVTCPADRTLSPDEFMDCTATYVVQQADVDAGSVDNSATATGTPPTGDPVTSEPSAANITGTQTPAISIKKSSDTAVLVVGETVTFSFVVTNTGNVTLTDAAVQDVSFTGAGTISAVDCPAERTLTPGAQMVCTATYVVQQADVDAGSMENTATATGTPPSGTPVTSDPSTTRTPSVPEPSVSIVKTADKRTLVAGETVTYSFRVTNTGNVTLTNASVVEGTFSGAGAFSAVDCPADRTLSPNEFMECTATYVVQQADVDAGRIRNSATSTGTPPTGDPVVSGPSEVSITATQSPAITIVKSADKTQLVAGETVTYTFLVTNTGNVTLTDAAVVEGGFTGAGALSALDCPADRTLAPGGELECTATYAVQQADVDAGAVDNSATATGNPPTGDPVVSEPSEVNIAATQSPAITIVKSADKTQLVLGETVTYTFLVTNTGNVTLTDASVVEGEFTGAGALSALDCPAARTLAPGGELECTATYVVQQADVDAGAVDNSATATGNPPTGEPVVSAPSAVNITATQSPAITIVKSSDKTQLVLGETITYSFVVTNAGNVTLSDVAIEEGEFTGAGDISAVECPADRTLAPGAQLICTATYVVQQADVDAGRVANTATATGTPPGGDPIESDPSTTTSDATPAPALAIVKTADKTDLVVGETVTYTFTVTNTGNVTMSDVAVAEGDFSGAGELSALDCPDARTLIPGQQLVCTATYTVQQADVDAGTLENSATASGTPPTGEPVVTDPSRVVIEGTQSPALSLVKVADKQIAREGDTVTYTFTVTNTGNVTIADVAIAEGAFTGAGALSTPVCADGARSLAPGEKVVCTATYVVQKADEKKGSLENTATVTGTPPSGPKVVSDPSTAKTGVLAVALPPTGGELAVGALTFSVLLMLAGAGLIARRRRSAP